jgi:hypothetical protein
VKLLVDHNLPPRLASALNVIFEPDHRIVALRDHFRRSDLKDEDWIPALGREGDWAVLSADMNIARKRPSRELCVTFSSTAVKTNRFIPGRSPTPPAWRIGRRTRFEP